jgi:WD40 repeat protein/uncharacterized caspase-like protein
VFSLALLMLSLGAVAQDKPRPEIIPTLGHSHDVTALAFSPDGSRFLSASLDQTVKLWETSSGRLLRTFRQQSLSINVVAYSPDGRKFVSGGHDQKLRVWDTETSHPLHVLEGHANEKIQRAASESDTMLMVYAVFSPDAKLILSGGADKLVKLWDVATGNLVRTFAGHSEAIRAVAFSPDGKRVLSAANDIRLWETGSGRLLKRFKASARGVVDSIAFSPDGIQVLAGLGERIGVWDASTGSLVRTFGESSDGTGFSPDGKRALSPGGYPYGTVSQWETSTGKLINRFEVSKERVQSIAYSPDARLVLTGADDRIVRLWDADTGKLMRTFEGRVVPAHAATFSPDGALIVSGDAETGLKLWEAASGRLLRTFDGHPGGIKAVVFSPDGKHIISGGADQKAKLWDADTGELLQIYEGHTRPVTSVAFSGDGTRMLSASGEEDIATDESFTMKLWDAQPGSRTSLGLSVEMAPGDSGTGLSKKVPEGVRVSEVFTSGPAAAAGIKKGDTILAINGTRISNTDAFDRQLAKFAPDDILKLLIGRENKQQNLSVKAARQGGNLLHTFEGTYDSMAINSIALSPDGRRALSGGKDFKMKLWDVASGRLIRTFEGKQSEIMSVAFSPDGARAASASNGIVMVWDVESGRVVRAIQHSDWVYSVAFAPDGTKLASGGADHLVKLWDVTSGRLLRTLEGHSGAVKSVVFSADGVRLLSASEDATLKVWNTATGQSIASMVVGRDNEWLTMTGDGFFAASSNGADLIHVVRGYEVTTIDQVHQALFNPDLVRETLASDPTGEVKRAADVLNLDKVLDSGPAPSVRVLSPGSAVATDLVTVQALVTDRGQGVGRTEWRVNGITTGVAAKPAGEGPNYVFTQQLALEPGDNTIEVVAYNASNLLASLPARSTIKFTGTAEAVTPKLHILAIGINKYVDQGWTPPDSNKRVSFPLLGLAVKDATTLAADLRRAAAGLYTDVHVELALDEQATRDSLETTVARFAQDIHPRDTVILFVAGHGYSLDGRFYLIPQDFQGGSNPEALAAHAIGQDRLQDWLANRIKAGKVIVLLDTCEAGALIGGHTRSRTEGASEAAIGRLHEATGRPVLTAAATGQFAHEGVVGPSGDTHGIFTWTLLDALRNGDRNANGLIELSEIVTHVQAQVPRLAEQLKRNGRAASIVATPVFGKQSARFGSRGEDFALVRRLQ